MNFKFDTSRTSSWVHVSDPCGAVLTNRKISALLIGVLAAGMSIGFLMSTYQHPRPVEPWDHPELACR